MNQVYVTALNTDSYLPGVLALAACIRRLCAHRLVVLLSDDLQPATYQALARRGIAGIRTANLQLPPALAAGLPAMFSHWAKTLFKLKVFGLTQFERVVYIDSDMLLLEAIDEVFSLPDMSAVVAGKSAPGGEAFEALNSGLMVFAPREGLVEKMVEKIPRVAEKKQAFGDQDVIAEYLEDWVKSLELHMDECYNVFFNSYSYYAKHGGVKAVHFNGRVKPWMMGPALLLRELAKCLAKGNLRGIPVLLAYRRLLKEVMANE